MKEEKTKTKNGEDANCKSGYCLIVHNKHFLQVFMIFKM